MEAETKEETNPLEGVQGDYMLITTFRKNGEGVPTPTWYGRENGKLYLFSLADAGKIKRVRNNPKVEVASCTFKGKPTGPTIPAQARIVPKEEEFVARRALRRHYPIGFRWSEFFANGLLRRKWTFLEMFPYPQTDRHEGPLPLRQP